MRCTKCGIDNAAGARFCNQCATPLGHACPKCARVNALDARFCAECAAALPPHPSKSNTPASSTRTVRIALAPAEPEVAVGERKTVTALFADIKGSMDLIEDLDPEEARAIVDPALNLMIDAVHRYGGYVVQSTGDGILALFGAPTAHEDHPQRALFAAIRMQEDLKRYADKLRERGQPPLSVRVGVNSGEVVVRSIQTDEAHAEYTPIGYSISLAARLQTLASPGSVVIGESVRKFVEGYFQLKALGPSRIKGVSRRVNVYEVTGLGPLRTRLQRAAGRGYSKFVGRQREMDAMKAAAEQARAGHGQIVAAIAEPGVGKSRLFHEFKLRHTAGWRVLEALTFSHGKVSAYLPILELLHGYFRIEWQDDQRTRREKITGRLAILDREFDDALPYLYGLLGIATEPDPLAQMDAQIRKRGTLGAIKHILLRESLNQPLMLIFEDLHWIDEGTQEFLNLIADSIGTAKILLLVSYRPEYSHQWNSKTYYSQLRLDPLEKESADDMLRSLLGGGAELAPLQRLIIEKTEGNPLFIEEMIQVMFDDGALVRDGTVKLTKSLSELKVPPTVQAILTARIDRLPPAEKDLLQILAVIGKQFPLSLARAVLDSSADELGRMLDDLQMGEFIYEQPAIGDIEYTFKHALTQEVAYNSILIERRKTLHERIGAAIGTLYKDSRDDHLSQLADHYSRSLNTEKAVEYQALAAKRELSQSGYQGALRRLQSAIQLFAKLPDSTERAELEIDLQMDYGAALLATRGWWVPEAGQAYQRARELCQQKDEGPQLFQVLSGLHSFHLVRGEHPTALAYADEMIGLADRLRDERLQAGAHVMSGFSKFFMGEFTGAHSSFELTIGYYDRERLGSVDISTSHQDPMVSALCYDAITLWMLGYPDRAEQRAFRSLERARLLGHPFTLTWCLSQLSMYNTIRRDLEALEKTTSEGLLLCGKHGLAFLEEQITFYRLLGTALQGKFNPPTSWGNESRSAEAAFELALTWALPIVACGLASLGRFDMALAFIAQSAQLVERNQERYVESEIQRIGGELTVQQVKGGSSTPQQVLSAESATEQSFMKAIEIARKRNAKSLELRAATSLARLLGNQGKRDDARAMLSEIYNWFTEGFDTADLKDASALLEELSA